MKKFFSILLTVALTAGMTACGGKGGTSQGTNSEVASQTESAGGTSADLDKDFSEWTNEDMLAYFQSEGVFTDESITYVQTGDEVVEGMTSIVSYQDDMYDADEMILYLDADSPLDATEKMWQEIKDTKELQMSDDEAISSCSTR